MRKAKWANLFVAILFVATGCQKLHYTQTYKLGPANIEDIGFEAPVYNQHVTVTIDPKSAGVSAYLVRESDRDAVEKKLRKKQEPDAGMLLGSRVSTGAPQTYTFEASVPAKTAYALLLKGSSKVTEVKVTVVGR